MNNTGPVGRNADRLSIEEISGFFPNWHQMM